MPFELSRTDSHELPPASATGAGLRTHRIARMPASPVRGALCGAQGFARWCGAALAATAGASPATRREGTYPVCE
jgi:hypothetical protein